MLQGEGHTGRIWKTSKLPASTDRPEANEIMEQEGLENIKSLFQYFSSSSAKLSQEKQ